ncbi:MAG TPA: hypothetical protein VKP12_11525, partial [Kiloniellaceae bacterium]|nr:hypothetical protein [Kiloniellaceae bacterium]
VQIQGDNFVLAFDDNGDGTPDSQVVFLDLVTVAEAGDAPTFQIAGVDIGSEVLLGQALALAGEGEVPLDDVAAGPGGLGGGASAYNDNLGDLLDLLVAQGVIPPTVLEFRLIELEDRIDILVEAEENPMLINEIGVNVLMTVPLLPGSEPDGGEGGGDYGPALLARGDGGEGGYGGYCEEEARFNFVELINTSDEAFDASGHTLEILNPAGEVVTFTLPDGTVIPAGGFVVFYQAAGDDLDDGLETIYIRIFDAQGNVVGGSDVDGQEFWALGLDTTFPIAVNLVDDGDSVDTFAANLTQEQLNGSGLTDPDFIGTPNLDGAPAGFGSPLLNLNFDTFNGQFTGNHHIFSRVDLDDTDSQNDWTTNNVPTDGTLNDTDLSELIAYAAGDKWLLKVDLETGEKEFIGQIRLFGVPVDVEGLTFGQGEHEGFLLGYVDNDHTIVKIDPATGEVVGAWTAFFQPGHPHLDNPGFAVAADGDLYAVGDNGVYAVNLTSSFTYELVLVADASEFGDFEISGLAADPTDADLLYAIGSDGDGNVKLFTVTAGGVVTQLGGVIPGAAEADFGLSFDAFGRLWAVDEDNGRAFQVDPATGDMVPGTEIFFDFGGFALESLAIQPHIVDHNPWDPLNDDLNPQQVNPDPLAGQNFLQAAGGGDLVEGKGGPDFILGAGGDDSLYGGSQELYEQQQEKVLEQFVDLMFKGEIFKDGAAGLNHNPYFSDHNDFLFGDAGDDNIYGGSGGDYMIGGQGDDSMDGGTGDDQIYGDGSEDIGGLPAGDLNHAGDDVIAGDALNNVDLGALFGDYGDGGEGGGDYGPLDQGGEFAAAGV